MKGCSEWIASPGLRSVDHCSGHTGAVGGGGNIVPGGDSVISFFYVQIDQGTYTKTTQVNVELCNNCFI